MFIQIIITLTSGLLLAVSLLVVGKIISERLALRKFIKVSRGLPMIPDVGLIGNHLNTLALGRNNCTNLVKWHNELGKTIGWLRDTTYCVSTTDLNLIKKIIQDEPEAHLDRITLHMPIEEMENSIMLAPKDEWRQLRRIIAPAFTANKFKTPNVIEEVEVSISNLIGHIDRKLANVKPDYLFEVDALAQRYSGDLVARSFYKRDNLIDFDDPHDFWTTMIEKSLTELQNSVFVRISMIFPMFRRAIDWLSWHVSPQGLGRRTTVEFVKSQTILGLEARKQIRNKNLEAKKTGAKMVDSSNFVLNDGTVFKRNMVDHIIDQFLDGKISKREYLNNSCFLMAAANRTASDCIVHTIYLLAINQDIQEELRDSIKADGTESELLERVLLESLRLMPTAPIGCSRVISRDIEIEGGYMLPAKTFVHTNAFVIHRLKEYWGEDADEFKPERWLDTSHHHPFQYIPFGAGPRGCPGRMFAMHQLKMLFVALLMRYKFQGRPNDKAYSFSSPFWVFLMPDSPMYVKIRKLQDT